MATSGAFPLLALLETLPDVFAAHLVPALQARHKAALALSCAALREGVNGTATRVVLDTRSEWCMVRLHALSASLPRLSSLVVKPGNLHEAMSVLPLFLMQDGRLMRHVTSLELHDELQDRPPDDEQCASCSAYASTYDLSAMLATAHLCLSPGLRSLTFATHFISDAELAAIGAMTGLTRLVLRSSHGTHTGGLGRLTSLSLVDLELADRLHSSRASSADLAMLLGRSALTRLTLGHAAVVVPLLTVLAEMHSDAYEQAGQATGVAGAPRQPGGRGPALAAAPAADLLAGAAAASGVDKLQLQASPGRALPAPPPLVSLSLVLTPTVTAGQLTSGLSALCCLSQLTQLSLGWAQARIHEINFLQHETVQPPVEVSVQQQLSKLGRLRSLALGWPAAPEVLGALAAVEGLTALQLGGLFTAQQQPQQPEGARPAPAPLAPLLPSVRRLRVHAETTARLRAGRPEPLRQARCLDALAGFPALTCLELTGRVYGQPLARLPTLVPAWRSSLVELLLPQRMGGVDASHLAALKQLTALTHLRLGWRSTAHHGPAGYAPVPADSGPQEQAGQPQRLTLAALTSSDGGVAPGPAPAEVATAAGEAAAAEAPRAARCSSCGQALPLPGCLCRLASLEVVGPLPPWELQHVRALPALRTLVLRDNISWASGGFADAPQLSELFSAQLSRLELLHCAGITPGDLEGRWAREQTGRHIRGPPADLVLAPRSGVCAHELGRGWSFMGVTLTASEEAGVLPEDVPAWEHASLISSERLDVPDDGGGAGGVHVLPHLADVGDAGFQVVPAQIMLQQLQQMLAMQAQAGQQDEVELGAVEVDEDDVVLAEGM